MACATLRKIPPCSKLQTMDNWTNLFCCKGLGKDVAPDITRRRVKLHVFAVLLGFVVCPRDKTLTSCNRGKTRTRVIFVFRSLFEKKHRNITKKYLGCFDTGISVILLSCLMALLRATRGPHINQTFPVIGL